eukprot:7378349-Prymnesium_polylepis.1
MMKNVCMMRVRPQESSEVAMNVEKAPAATARARERRAARVRSSGRVSALPSAKACAKWVQ